MKKFTMKEMQSHAEKVKEVISEMKDLGLEGNEHHGEMFEKLKDYHEKVMLGMAYYHSFPILTKSPEGNIK
ncbi:hypothetical protein EOM86_04790 [Candidatus Nomurabacteria bacterium]|nr:hypothetical protein [Candidatus Nomurabacteria bacterium]